MTMTLFSLDALGSPVAFLIAAVVGGLFGVLLEQAGFSSARRLTDVFYLRHMTVVKVLFTAMATAALGLAYASALGMVADGDVYLLPTVYGAMGVGGVIFGMGFVLGGWCPGTAAVGLASGAFDALFFAAGVLLGSAAFNEAYPLLGFLYNLGDAGAVDLPGLTGLSRPVFLALFAVVAIAAFAACEAIERRARLRGNRAGFVLAALLLLAGAAGLFVVPQAPPAGRSLAMAGPDALVEEQVLATVRDAADHMEPEELADRLLAGDDSLLLVDVRPPEDYAAFHIRGAVNVELPDLPGFIANATDRHVILYSNGMTHPAQARDALARLGHANVYILTDGLTGFRERVLLPASLRDPAPDAETAARINAWRSFFLGGADVSLPAAPAPLALTGRAPHLVDPGWLAAHLDDPRVVILDVRPQPAYNAGHIPGSYCLSPDSVRGVVGGLSSMLLPRRELLVLFGQMGIRPGDTVVLAPGKVRDATLVLTALLRAGVDFALLDGGFPRWAAEGLPVDTLLPAARPAREVCPPRLETDGFSVSGAEVLAAVERKDAVILDVRPADAYSGETVEEARGGHIPGAKNRPFSLDVAEGDDFAGYKPLPELEAAYAALIPSRDAKVIVHCRTGHQASQTFFLLRALLGYANVWYYDAGWSEWASRPEWPVATGPAPGQ